MGFDGRPGARLKELVDEDSQGVTAVHDRSASRLSGKRPDGAHEPMGDHPTVLESKDHPAGITMRKLAVDEPLGAVLDRRRLDRDDL